MAFQPVAVLIKIAAMALVAATGWTGVRETRQAVAATKAGPAAGPLSPAEARPLLHNQPLEALTLRRLAEANGSAEAGHLMGLAERISRRDPVAELWRIEAAVAAGSPAEALDHYDRALAVAPQTGQFLLPILARNLEDPAVRLPLAAYARREWFDRLMADALPSGAPAEAVNDLILRAAAAAGPDRASRWHRTLVNQLAARNRFDLLARYLAADPRRVLARPAQLGFAAAASDPANAPFAWQLDLGTGIEAEPDSQGGLRMTADSGREGLAARRLTLLPAGRYDLNVAVATEAGAEPAQVTLAVGCATPGLAGPLGPTPLRPGVSALPVVITADCPAQVWSLSVGAALTQSPSVAVVSPLRLTR